ncbi:hypothetical protein AYO21_02166 [Fonsecaea monophora]|uniref:glutathione transferase n=1 Tax=Fonsecaea monophora TaxID=254056 RepID=A0A177FIV9_9EURO|nr:hypothetical protein AYO21_02166 [Fonsecaea monophora]OAG43580.1 hypothetical protein AYO21_02166 [Fonsecaea monophora]
MTVKLWTSPLSWNCVRVEHVLAEKGIEDVEIIPADLIGGKHKASRRSLNPRASLFGRVPLLEDGDVVIFESRAIARYLCEKYAAVGPRLMPPEGTDAGTRGVWEMRLILEAVEFDVHVAPVISETIIRPALGKPTDEAVIARHKPKLLACLDVLDKALSELPYMGGTEYSLVDILYMPCMFTASRCLELFEGRPNLKRWWDTVSGREAWKRAVKPLDEGYGQVVPGWKK